LRALRALRNRCWKPDLTEPAWRRQWMQQMCIASLQGIMTGRFIDVITVTSFYYEE